MQRILKQPPSPWRHWKLVVAAILLAGLAMVGFVWYQYQSTKQPLQDLSALPWVPQALTSDAPRYALSIYGEDSLDRPLGVAASSSSDHVYVSESGGERAVRVFDRDGQEMGALVPPNTTEITRVPLYLALAPDGRLFASDRPNHAVYIYSPTGEFVGAFQPQTVPAGDWSPMGLAFDDQGNLYVTDVSPDKHRVLVFDSAGALKLQFGSQGTAPGQFWFPNGIAVDRAGRIYVADGNNGRVQVFDPQGELLSVIPRGYGPGDLAMPRGLAIDGHDRLYVADTSTHVVKIYDISGDKPAFKADFGGYGNGDGQFRFPNGVAVDGANRVYVTDRDGGRLQIWSY